MRTGLRPLAAPSVVVICVHSHNAPSPRATSDAADSDSGMYVHDQPRRKDELERDEDREDRRRVRGPRQPEPDALRRPGSARSGRRERSPAPPTSQPACTRRSERRVAVLARSRTSTARHLAQGFPTSPPRRAVLVDLSRFRARRSRRWLHQVLEAVDGDEARERGQAADARRRPQRTAHQRLTGRRCHDDLHLDVGRGRGVDLLLARLEDRLRRGTPPGSPCPAPPRGLGPVPRTKMNGPDCSSSGFEVPLLTSYARGVAGVHAQRFGGLRAAQLLDDQRGGQGQALVEVHHRVGDRVGVVRLRVLGPAGSGVVSTSTLPDSYWSRHHRCTPPPARTSVARNAGTVMYQRRKRTTTVRQKSTGPHPPVSRERRSCAHGHRRLDLPFTFSGTWGIPARPCGRPATG